MLRVITYHRVGNPEQTPLLHPRLVSATPEVFALHMQHLARRYRVVSMPEVLDATLQCRPLPRRAVLVTFDDAYRDFLDAAWPILRAHRLPATMFVPTDYPGHPQRSFWWDRLHRCFSFTARQELEGSSLGDLPLRTPAQRRASLAAMQAHVKSLPHAEGMAQVEACAAALGEPACDQRAVLSWDELRTLARQGLTVCAHSRSHPLLTRLMPERVREEVVGSLQDLRREMGEALPIFSYPNGAYDDTAVGILRAESVTLAFTQIDGHNDLRGEDPLRLRRTNITRRSSPVVFRLRLLHWLTFVDRWRHGERSSASLG
jgi:peptidoglycan/xylan/chitin deacetylase (PgdA/CDA1 family)